MLRAAIREKHNNNHANKGNQEVMPGAHVHPRMPVCIGSKRYAAAHKGKEGATHQDQEHPSTNTSASMLHATHEGNQRGAVENHAQPHTPAKGEKGMPTHTRPNRCTQNKRTETPRPRVTMPTPARRTHRERRVCRYKQAAASTTGTPPPRTSTMV